LLPAFINALLHNSSAISMPGILVPNKLKLLGKSFGKPGVIDISVVFQKIVGQNCREMRLVSYNKDRTSWLFLSPATQ